MPETFNVLIRKRGVLKSRITLFKKYLDNLRITYESLPNGESLDSVTVNELKSRLSRQEALYVEFDQCQSEIEILADDVDEQISERDSFENNFHKFCSEADNIIQSNSKTFNTVISVDKIAGSSNISTPFSGLKLPQIELPKFYGEYEQWLEFRDTFDSLIHKNPEISEVSKFHYLRAQLQGEARQVIHSIEVSNENYDIAWETLCERYNNSKLLIYSHLNSLVNMSPITNPCSSELREFSDNISKHLRALQQLNQPVGHWDTLLVFLINQKLDKNTHREWERLEKSKELASLGEFKTFIKNKADLLETIEFNNKDKQGHAKQKIYTPKQNYSFKAINQENHSNQQQYSYVRKPNANTYKHQSNVDIKCAFCKDAHYINYCTNFLKCSIDERWNHVNKLNLCSNCLRNNHYLKDCKSIHHCRICKSNHHTLLHKNDILKESQTNTENTNLHSSTNLIALSSYNIDYPVEVLLSTAMIRVKDRSGKSHICRALLDSGSQSSFITADFCHRLGLPTNPFHISIVGIGHSVSDVTEKCDISFESLHYDFTMSVSCLVITKISNNIPSNNVNVSSLMIPPHIKLADPEFNISGSIDILLGVNVFYHLLSVGQISLGHNQPILQKTNLGWIVSGPVTTSSSITYSSCNFSTEIDIQQQLSKFWEVEEIPSSNSSIFSCEEKMCEDIFSETITRDTNGRFIVTIPLKDSPSALGDSRQMALRRFHYLEKKFLNDPKLKEMYCQFLAEYEALGHMSLTSPDSSSVSYFFPHHGVINENSSTTKLRVVFNGSASTSSGLSFNDIQMVGPIIQDDLLSIILRFRIYKVVICADVEKMYRQILVHPSQRSLQQIIWRSNPDEEIKAYTLNTVTYGTSSAPFLSIRCLAELSKENIEKYPISANAIAHDFYVDDLLTGADTPEQAIQLGTEISSILKNACMNLRKWVSNDLNVLKQLSGDSNDDIIRFNNDETKKTLGLYWSSKGDELMYHIRTEACSTEITKRLILSDISCIFDPLGLLGPCIISGKIFLQKLWTHKLEWDETLPTDLKKSWQDFRINLNILNDIKIPRRVFYNNHSIQMHGFSDASQVAYGACIYIRTITPSNEIKVYLLCSKTKVAPLKVLTVPRLELCAALLLAKLTNKVLTSLKLNFNGLFFWSDSTITLGWINTPSNQLQTFVAHRVSQIQSITNTQHWHHIRTDENPADMLSRGIKADKMKDSYLWWHGPVWLSNDQCYFPKLTPTVCELPEMKKVINSFIITNKTATFIFEKFSSLIKLQRVIAYCFRFSYNCKNNEDRKTAFLTTQELQESMKCLVRLSQQESFPDEIQELLKGSSNKCRNKISSLNAFLDQQGIIRVGGRLQLSNFKYNKKHPMLLSSKHILTKLIFSYEHIRLLHAGPTLMLSVIRETYWPLSGRNLAKKIIHNCIKCFRTNPVQTTPLMGSLPSSRIEPMPPFFRCGVDYAGPFIIKDRKGRGNRQSKSYVCIFICFVTKAIHLEIVSDLTTEAFLATFRRFTSRRGKPQTVFSDNGITFIGARNELNNLGIFLSNHHETLTTSIINEGVNWKFIPPYSPHFGGLWEAGIKSSKYHMKRVMSKAVLTFEEFYTTLTQIEAILNSRPLTTLSSDPNDFEPLTPAHFLIGRKLTTLPDPSLVEIEGNRLSRFQRVQQLQQHFWTRWSKEYVSELQQRVKWKTNRLLLTVGSLVIIKEDNTSPVNWKLGRIVQLHPGSDGITRVATIKTHSGIMKRSFSKICCLPTNQ